MRILIVHEYNRPHGGAEQYLRDVCHALREMGHRVALVCARDHDQAFLPVDARYPIERSFGVRSGRRALPFGKEILRVERPDLVFLNGLGFFISPLVLRWIVRSYPSVLFVHYLDLVCPIGRKVVPMSDHPCEWAAGQHCVRKGCLRVLDGSVSGKLYTVILSLWRIGALRQCGRVIAPSQYVRQELVRNGFRGGRIRVLRHFTTKEDQPANEPEGRQILWVGRMEVGKGVDLFLRSLSLLKEQAWRAVIVGEGPELGAATELAARLGLADRVEFVGRLASSKLDAYYASSRILAFTPAFMETFGQVGIEAMAFGRPVVAYDAGGPSEWLVDRVTGFLVPRDDYGAMARRIASLLDDGALWRQMSEAARAWVNQRFRAERYLPALVRVFEEAIREYGASVRGDDP